MNSADEPVDAQPRPEEHAGPHRDRLRTLRLVSLIVLVVCAGFNVWLAHQNHKLYETWKAMVKAQRPEDLSEYGVIHMPPSGKCPAGFQAAYDIFERDGRKYAGCSRIGSDPNRGPVDRIDPGESFVLRIPIEPPRRPDPPSVRQ